MATRTSNKGKRLGKVQGWGIAGLVNGELTLVATGNSRDSLRMTKRFNYPGGDYKLVKIEATLTHYTK
jgi:hypothetical protein